MRLAIYGAQGYALAAYEAIRALYPEWEIPCFLVTHMEGNAPVLGGLPVREIDAFSAGLSEEEKREIEILIATPAQVQAEMEEILDKYGFRKRKRLTFEYLSELMEPFHARLGKFPPLASLSVGSHEPDVTIYMAKSHVDKPLRENITSAPYVIPIQVGAARSDVRVADLTDDTGDNISAKNGNYCELTALYWMWKNELASDGLTDGEKDRYYGLCQYRRGFDLKEEDLLRLADHNVDVVLPYPLPYEPDIHMHHKRYIREADWQALLKAIQELQPEYAAAFPEILEGRYLYNYNVILAKKSVLRDYCMWLFPILERVEELSSSRGSERNDRYIGYMGETLETLYFMKNVEKFTIVHTGCRMKV